MKQNRAEINNIVLLIVTVIFAVIVFKFVGLSPKIAIAVFGIAFFFLAFSNTDLALIFLVFSMLLSPELTIAQVPSRSVVVRIDDVLLIAIFLGWLAKTAMNKELGLLKHTPLNSLMVAYIAVCIITTLLGIMRSDINPPKSFFYIIKYIEYFLLYFMVTNNIKDKKQVNTFMACFMITAFIVCIYALLTVGKFGRATAPFEGAEGEPNTLGGYLMFMLAVFGGIFLHTSSRRWQIAIALIAPLMVITLLETLSRGSYLAFIFMYLVLIIFTRRRKIIIIGALVLGIVILPLTLPKVMKGVTKRVTYTFSGRIKYKTVGHEVALDKSAASRIENWKNVIQKLRKYPFFGYGVTGVGLVDIQYPRVLGETGIIGFLIFIWLLIRILSLSSHNLSLANDELSQGITFGFLAGFIGLLIHSFSANTFIIVRIMEPFWFMTAIVAVLPNLEMVQLTQ
ncbi:MAG: hypothetical protein B1H08_04395 [Candidatus Omnitrophica bacterium 4484_171]|nr:MAG: hypothetical protein B1H08_04395 [Candidatus Omnitrophica bacterium 4484_171]